MLSGSSSSRKSSQLLLCLQSGKPAATGRPPLRCLQVAPRQSLLRNRRATLLELRNHQYLLTKLNRDLVNTIQRQEDDSAQKVEAMLLQQKIVKTIIDVLEYVHKKKLQDLQSELQKKEKEEELKVNRLGHLVEELTANLQKTHKQVSFLSTYMDHEHPIKSIQIGNLVRQLQQMKDSQQEDLEDLREIQSKVLQSLYDQMHKKRENILHSLVTKTLYPYQESLLQKTKEIQHFLSYQEKFRESIGELEEKISKLRAEVAQLQQHNLEPREVLFPDILLRRPKCTPDMDVVLNIPMEEVLPF
ncbi:uncharacterized protein C20orf96 homolog [Suncus etruscus]|uniref:uncharacterized protein C20orf96 homolog n=1 Tax=Suncus etruscus TaxID=109475 RepID=UPI00210F9978|nr:uncharacterized protein C20orf96 homolog [Suncus etruscus]